METRSPKSKSSEDPAHIVELRENLFIHLWCGEYESERERRGGGGGGERGMGREETRGEWEMGRRVGWVTKRASRDSRPAARITPAHRQGSARQAR